MLTLIFNALVWAPQKEIFRIPGIDHPIVWYGLLFASGFIIGQQIMFRIYRKEGLPSRDIERMTVYMVVATVIGARLGHCLLYDPVGYLSDPISILKVWEGGLASHGGALGILVALWLYVRSSKTKGQSWLFVLDRIVIVVALGGAFIRMGNFVNNEMLGIETKSSAGVVFLTKEEDTMERSSQSIETVDAYKGIGDDYFAGRVPVELEITFTKGLSEADVNTMLQKLEAQLKNPEGPYATNLFMPGESPMDYTLDQTNNVYTAYVQAYGIVRHPAQLYEAIYCILLCVFLYWLWAKKRKKLREGVMLGIFMVVLFTLRILDEYLKLNQEDWEEGLALNAGQMYSIPLILMGIVILIYAYRKPTPKYSEWKPVEPLEPKKKKEKK